MSQTASLCNYNSTKLAISHIILDATCILNFLFLSRYGNMMQWLSSWTCKPVFCQFPVWVIDLTLDMVKIQAYKFQGPVTVCTHLGMAVAANFKIQYLMDDVLPVSHPYLVHEASKYLLYMVCSLLLSASAAGNPNICSSATVMFCPWSRSATTNKT